MSQSTMFTCKTFFSNKIFNNGSGIGTFKIRISRKLRSLSVFPELKHKLRQKYRLRFFNQNVSHFARPFEMLPDCPILCLVVWSRNLIRGNCQLVNICMNRLDRQTRDFSIFFSISAINVSFSKVTIANQLQP